MRNLLNLRMAVATVVLAGAAVIGSLTASAGDYCHAPHDYYKTVTVYESIRTPYEYTVVRYDHCGDPYAVTLTAWKTIQIPVTKRVRVLYESRSFLPERTSQPRCDLRPFAVQYPNAGCRSGQ